MKHGPIHLHIDELVLHGFNPADRHQIADAVERELAALLANGGLETSCHLGQGNLRIPTFNVSAPSSAGMLGRQIAESVLRADSLIKALSPLVSRGTGQ